MGDTMMLGVLRMPPELWGKTAVDVVQRHGYYKAAADRIEKDAARIRELENDLFELGYHYCQVEAKLLELVEATEWRDECDEARRYCFWRREDYSRTNKHWHRWGESLWHAIQLLDEAESAYQDALEAVRG